MERSLTCATAPAPASSLARLERHLDILPPGCPGMGRSLCASSHGLGPSAQSRHNFRGVGVLHRAFRGGVSTTRTKSCVDLGDPGCNSIVEPVSRGGKTNHHQHPSPRHLPNRLRNSGVLGHSWALSLSKIQVESERAQVVANHRSHPCPFQISSVLERLKCLDWRLDVAVLIQLGIC